MKSKSLAKAVHDKLGATVILVDYEYRTGTQEFPMNVLLELNGRTPKDAIHEYFKDYWEDTTVEEYAETYLSYYYDEVRISKWTSIPVCDIKVLRKYFYIRG